jgi:hypothetical protein
MYDAPQMRSSAIAGSPDLCTEILGISPSLLDLISGAVYRCIALAFDDHRSLRYRIATSGLPTPANTCTSRRRLRI